MDAIMAQQLSSDIIEAWRVAGLGLARVFAVLLMFAVVIKVMIKLFPAKESDH